MPLTFLGWRKDIDALFAASDIAILTSDNEGIPLTLIQAAQAGLPIVAPSVGSISDIVINKETGALVAPHEMANALLALIDNAELRATYGAAGKARAQALFSLTKELSDHASLYEISQSR